MSPSSATWTTSTTTSSALQPPLPPPPPPPVSSSSAWDFWDPFVPTSQKSVSEEEWEENTVTTTTIEAASVVAPPSVAVTTTSITTSELAVVVSTKGKDLVEIVKELDEYFLKAADAGRPLSLILEVPTCTFSDQRSSGRINGSSKSFAPLLWTWGSSSSKWNAFADQSMMGDTAIVGGPGFTSHCSTVERLYAWEKKLYLEVKNAETLKLEHDKKSDHLRKLEMKRADYMKTETTRKEVEKLESRMMVASQAIESTSAEIIKLRETELYPQLVELVKGLICMWRSMYEYHHVQSHIVQQLKYLNTVPSTEPTSEIHRQSTLQLELEVQQWHLSFCSLVKAQREYVQSLTGWLRLSLFQVGNNPIAKSGPDSAIYSLCEQWQLAVNNAPDKVASEAIKSLLTVIHAVVLQQAEEQKQKRRSEVAFKDLEKKAGELRGLENKYGPYSMSESTGKNPVGKKRTKVNTVRVKAEDEKARYDKLVSVTRSMTLNNLQMGLPLVFEAVTRFANVCTNGFETNASKALFLARKLE
ncbi:hypothetical protein Leryth_006992 [Lithospermum erythrorhizon]|nr:hypothetical protein Leryth_006992 [Lithospermum erythrorhizon]